jgi:hypothetical protein
MFDTPKRDDVTLPLLTLPVLQLVSVQIMPTGDGLLAVSLSGTYLDEEQLELVNGEIEGAKVSSIEEALVVIGRALTDAFQSATAKEGH